MAILLSQNIKLIRGLLGKTQKEFADLIGVKLSNLKTYETSDIMPKVQVLKRIAEIAGVSMDEVVNKELNEADIIGIHKAGSVDPSIAIISGLTENNAKLTDAIVQHAHATRIKAEESLTTSKNYKTLIDAAFTNKKPVTKNVTKATKK